MVLRIIGYTVQRPGTQTNLWLCMSCYLWLTLFCFLSGERLAIKLWPLCSMTARMHDFDELASHASLLAK